MHYFDYGHDTEMDAFADEYEEQLQILDWLAGLENEVNDE
jgi:hypothetical protein